MVGSKGERMTPEIRREAFYWERIEALQRAAATMLELAKINPTACLRGLAALREAVPSAAPPTLAEMPEEAQA